MAFFMRSLQTWRVRKWLHFLNISCAMIGTMLAWFDYILPASVVLSLSGLLIILIAITYLPRKERKCSHG